MYGIIKVGAINCGNEEELCEEFSAFEIPQILIFSESFNEDGERYRGNLELNSLANAAAKKMQSFVSIVSEQNYDSFCERENKNHHVILFTDKKSTPAILKSLSKKYIKKLLIGEIRSSEPNLIQKFNIQQFPTLIVLTNCQDSQGEVYQGEFKVDQLSKFLDLYASKQVETEPNFELLTERKYKSNQLCGAKDSKLCFILFDPVDQDYYEMLHSLPSKYRDE